MFLGPFLNYEAQRATSNSMETSTEGQTLGASRHDLRLIHLILECIQDQCGQSLRFQHLCLACISKYVVGSGEWCCRHGSSWRLIFCDIIISLKPLVDAKSIQKPGTLIWAQKLTEGRRYRRKLNKKQNLFNMRIFVRFLVSGRVANWGQGWSLTNVIL